MFLTTVRLRISPRSIMDFPEPNIWYAAQPHFLRWMEKPRTLSDRLNAIIPIPISHSGNSFPVKGKGWIGENCRKERDSTLAYGRYTRGMGGSILSGSLGSLGPCGLGVWSWSCIDDRRGLAVCLSMLPACLPMGRIDRGWGKRRGECQFRGICLSNGFRSQ